MIFNKEKLENYILKGDVISDLLAKNKSDAAFTSRKWLDHSLPKRAIYDNLYGDLLKMKSSKKILDVGGGFCSLSDILVNNHDYHLLDIMAHDDVSSLGDFLIRKDWYEFVPDKYDMVISNDLFPNVDQRLELFLEKYLPITKEIRMSLTYYNTPRFYITKRVGADEIFCQLAYNGHQIRDILKKFFDGNFEALLLTLPSLFQNGRQIEILKRRLYEGQFIDCSNR